MQVGRYRTTGVLGEGAAGVVYRATDGDAEVAVKVLRAPDSTAQKRFEREARLAGEASSRHLVPILETGDGWFAMPLYRGGSLAARLRADGPVPVAEVVDLAAQLARGLDALHARGVVHRDVKPSNVLLDGAGTAAHADFGLARGEGATQLTRDGQLVGTVHYLAPELIEGADASVASDVYALGCLLYECVTGAPPFAGRNDAEVGFAHLVEAPPPPRGVSADVALALLSALEKDPSARPTSATALARMLHLAHNASHARSRA